MTTPNRSLTSMRSRTTPVRYWSGALRNDPWYRVGAWRYDLYRAALESAGAAALKPANQDDAWHWRGVAKDHLRCRLPCPEAQLPRNYPPSDRRLRGIQ